jgi:hypothetical protein
MIGGTQIGVPVVVVEGVCCSSSVPVLKHIFFIELMPALINGVIDFLVDLTFRVGNVVVVVVVFLSTRIALATSRTIVGEAVPATTTTSTPTTMSTSMTAIGTTTTSVTAIGTTTTSIG